MTSAAMMRQPPIQPTSGPKAREAQVKVALHGTDFVVNTPLVHWLHNPK
jgi:hypothetical protein